MINDYIQALQNRIFHKLIIGAAIKDFNSIEGFAYLASHAEANAVDISAFPSSVINAKTGINKAREENPNLAEPLIMVSVNIGEDPHFRRILLDENNCTECLECIPSCPADAFSIQAEKFHYNIDLCYGCSNCLDYCNYEALDFENWNSFDSRSLDELINLGANAIEIHLNNDLQSFQNFYSTIPKDFLLESFCIGSERMTDKEIYEASLCIINSVKEKYGHIKPFIIQTDGKPLSGARFNDQADKDLQSIGNAKISLDLVKSLNHSDSIFIQLAGGITEHSLAKAFSRDIEVNGVAMGSYLRNKVLDLQKDDLVYQDKELKNFVKELLIRSKSLANLTKR